MTAFAFIGPAAERNILLALIGGCYLGYHLLRWWRNRRANKAETISISPKTPQNAAAEPSASGLKASTSTDRSVSHAAELSDSHSKQSVPDSRPSSELSGEELYVRARAMPHQPIPNVYDDGEYLETLGKSAALGCTLAMAKLGEYARRRAGWVEAYYWMKKAQRNGMRGLDPVLRDIRGCWARDGFADPSCDICEPYTVEADSIGRAWLDVDSGHKAAQAREFLKAHHPDLLPF